MTSVAMNAPTASETIWVSPPNSSASDAETLSTSPVGLRRDSTEPSWVDLRVTSFIGPYIPISQERTTIAW